MPNKINPGSAGVFYAQYFVISAEEILTYEFFFLGNRFLVL